MNGKAACEERSSGSCGPPSATRTFDVHDLRELAASRGVDFRRETGRDHWLRPLTWIRLPILCTNAQELELPHRPWPRLHYVGPMVERARPELLATGEAWPRLLERRRSVAEPPPLVYCSLGTFWSADSEFLRRVVAAFERRTEWQLVLGLGGRLDPAELGAVPGNVLVLDYAPQAEILAEASCAITHGGVTSLNECLSMGVPMVVYSTGHVDQNGCAERVRFHRLGLLGDRVADDSRAIEAKVERVLGDADIRANVERLRAVCESYRSEDRAVELIATALAR